jgi:N-acyl-D-aspartate/D-glutamate deacylase
MKLRTILSVLFILLLVVVIYFVVKTTSRPEFDIIIKNGTIADGLGGKPYRADIGILKNKIKEIGDLAEEGAPKVIDAAGLMVCPGFIDLHTHVDHDILKHPDAHNYIRQGVTTALGGNCGGSKYPVGDFLKEVEQTKIALNFCTLVGHNTIRRKVMGNADKEPEQKEMAEMKQMAEQAMKEGAVGISTGLKYMPGAFSKTREVIELAKVVQQYGGFYATHMREEGMDILTSVRETVEIGKAAHIPVHISHHKITSVEKWGNSTQTLAMVDEAREAGVDATLDQYPYPATSTGLTVLFPAWALEGDREERKARWTDEKIKPKLVDGIKYNIEHDRGGNDLDRIMIARYVPEPEMEGLTIKQILEKKGTPITMENGVEMILHMQMQAMEMEGRVQAIYFCLSDEDIERIIKHPLTSHASDGGITTFNEGNPHPRNYGTFPRILKTYVREKGILSFEQAIRKMTSLPAKRLGLEKRGCIKEGCYADIVIVDPVRVSDTATWQQPHRYPGGIPYVLVNGQLVVENHEITGTFPGMVIYGKGKKLE